MLHVCRATRPALTGVMPTPGPHVHWLVIDLGAAFFIITLHRFTARQGPFHHLAPPAHYLDYLEGKIVDDRFLKISLKDYEMTCGTLLRVVSQYGVMKRRHI
jgi:hypothetical protein